MKERTSQLSRLGRFRRSTSQKRDSVSQIRAACHREEPWFSCHHHELLEARGDDLRAAALTRVRTRRAAHGRHDLVGRRAVVERDQERALTSHAGFAARALRSAAWTRTRVAVRADYRRATARCSGRAVRRSTSTLGSAKRKNASTNVVTTPPALRGVSWMTCYTTNARPIDAQNTARSARRRARRRGPSA